MAETQDDSFVDGLKQDSLETAKELAPWRAGLAWWVILIEGIVLGILGILMLINIEQTSINVSLAMAAVLLVVGIFQLWAVIRNKAPESVDSLIAARGSIAAFSGLNILLLYFLNRYYGTEEYLTMKSGLIVFGLGCLTYGLTGFVVAMRVDGRRRRSGLLDGVFFTLFGVLLFYVMIAGGEAVNTAMRIIGIVAIFGALALVGLAFYNRSRDAEQEKMDEQAKEAVEKAEDAKDDANAATKDADEARKQQEKAEEEARKQQEEARRQQQEAEEAQKRANAQQDNDDKTRAGE